jgi:hypothetical protein
VRNCRHCADFVPTSWLIVPDGSDFSFSVRTRAVRPAHDMVHAEYGAHGEPLAVTVSVH